MYADLPGSVKEQINHFLRINDFKTAKEIYDNWQPEPAIIVEKKYKKIVHLNEQ